MTISLSMVHCGWYGKLGVIGSSNKLGYPQQRTLITSNLFSLHGLNIEGRTLVWIGCNGVSIPFYVC